MHVDHMDGPSYTLASTRDQREEGIKSGSLCFWLPPSVSPWAAPSLSPRSHLFSRWPSSHNVLVLDPSTCSIIYIFLTHITAWCPVLFLVISLPPAHTSPNSPFTKPPGITLNLASHLFPPGTRTDDIQGALISPSGRTQPDSPTFKGSLHFICVNCLPWCLIDT